MFAYAEALEADKQYDEVKTTFDVFLGKLRADLEVVEQQVQDASSYLSSAKRDTPGTQSPVNAVGSQSSDYSFNRESDKTHPKPGELAEKRAEYGLVYISYMRFVRRTEGVQKSRGVFQKARQDRWTPWEVYEAAGEIIVVSTLSPLRLFYSGYGVPLLERRRHRHTDLSKRSKCFCHGSRVHCSLSDVPHLHH